MGIYRWCFFLLILGGCTATHITSEWQSQDIHPYRYRHILILASLPAAMQQWQPALETHLANDIAAMGYTTMVSSNTPYSKALKGKDEKTAIALLQQEKADAILTITLYSTAKERYHIPWILDYYFLDATSDYSLEYYNQALLLSSFSDYDPEHTIFYWETNLYDMLNGQQVYTLQTSALDINSAKRFSHRYGKQVVKRMKKAGILKQQYPSDLE